MKIIFVFIKLTTPVFIGSIEICYMKFCKNLLQGSHTKSGLAVLKVISLYKVTKLKSEFLQCKIKSLATLNFLFFFE